jgi:hypothetical protein
MIGLGLFVQMADTRDMRRVALLLRPSDGFVLGLKRPKDTVGVILHDVVLDRTTFLPAFGPGLDIDDGHLLSSQWLPQVES